MQTTGVNNKTLSVEISHTYLDQAFSLEQEQSIERFLYESKKWADPHQEVVLFDDYNIKHQKTTHEDILRELGKHQAMPKYYAFEKDMIVYVNQLLSNVVVPKVRRQYETYIQKYNRYPCSLLTAVWYLVRLGYIVDTNQALKPTDGQGIFVPASELINFLPNYFSGVEDKARKLIGATQFEGAADRIRNIYFDAGSGIVTSGKVFD